MSGGFEAPDWTLVSSDANLAIGESHVTLMKAHMVRPDGLRGGETEVTVRVLDEWSEPVGGVAIMLMPDRPGEEPGTVSSEPHTMTDDQGIAVVREISRIDEIMIVVADHPEYERSEQVVGVTTADDVSKEHREIRVGEDLIWHADAAWELSPSTEGLRARNDGARIRIAQAGGEIESLSGSAAGEICGLGGSGAECSGLWRVTTLRDRKVVWLDVLRTSKGGESSLLGVIGPVWK